MAPESIHRYFARHKRAKTLWRVGGEFEQESTVAQKVSIEWEGAIHVIL